MCNIVCLEWAEGNQCVIFYVENVQETTNAQY